MRILLNVIWLLLCGFWLAVGYALAGIICCILIVTIPFGLASFRMADFALWPFGRQLVKRTDAGWWLALAHIATAVSLSLTIIGIPLALANLKLVPVSLVPLGRVIVPIGEGQDPRYPVVR